MTKHYASHSLQYGGVSARGSAGIASLLMHRKGEMRKGTKGPGMENGTKVMRKLVRTTCYRGDGRDRGGEGQAKTGSIAHTVS